MHNTKKEEPRKWFVSAFAILWNRCLKKINLKLLEEFVQQEEQEDEQSPDEKPESDIYDQVNEVFSELNPGWYCTSNFHSAENLEELEVKLREKGLQQVLEEEDSSFLESTSKEELTLKRLWSTSDLHASPYLRPHKE